MAHEEAAFSRKHSAVSQNQNQSQRPFSANDAEDAKESKQNQDQHQRPLTTKDTNGTEGGKALSPSRGLPGDEQQEVQQRAQALALKLAQTYEELTRLLERNPGFKRQFTEGQANEDRVYQKLKQRLKLADMAPRCRWVRQDGTSCGSPQMKQHIYCFAHRQMAEARTLMLMLPAAEDANAIQMGLMRIQKALIEDTISTKKAGLLLYSMQLALTNVGRTTFGKAKDEEMVRETVDEEIALSQRQNQHQKPFTTEGTEDTEEIGSSGHPDIGTSENQRLPRMDTDERGLGQAGGKHGGGDVEFVPVPGGYGFERVRLRIGDKHSASCLKQEHFTAKDAEDAKESKRPMMTADSVLLTEPYANLR
jgi:hypothetical protein